MGKTFEARIMQKIDTHENWTSKNPVLLNGELIFSITSDGIRQKVGDGTSQYTALPFSDETVLDAIDSKADAEKGVFYIEGTGSTAGTWLGTHSDITAYYSGLMIAYKIGIAGGSSATTLNINSLGAVSVVRNATTAVTTNYPVGSVVFLVYTVDSSGTAYWKTADYDANNYAYVRQYYTTTNGNYPLIFKYDAGLTTTTNYVTQYTRTANNMYVNPSTGVITANGFDGDLSGNADTATKATQDSDGNNIVDTYCTKAELEEAIARLETLIAEAKGFASTEADM